MMINILSAETIDKIAAGEVVERPASCVKELCENSIDAGSTSISVEIKDGGISLIRVTDNGCGIEKDQIQKAFLRHATSKITSIEDLESLESLGFRGEALSSISAVGQTEIITKTKGNMTAVRYTVEGAKAGELSEVGAPDGTTIIIRNLFFNTPARRKFLKSNTTEGSYVAQVMEHLALSHPEVAFTFINGNKTVLKTSGRGDLKEVIYNIYGRDITKQLIPIEDVSLKGYIAKPIVARSNRAMEIFFVNGRYVKSDVISKAVEEAYKPFLMQHKFPMVVLHLDLSGASVDANVHPQKLEVRFSDNENIYEYVKSVVYTAIKSSELIPDVSLSDTKTKETANENFVSNIKDMPHRQENVAATENLEFEKSEAGDIKQESSKPEPSKPEPVKPAMPFEINRLLREQAEYGARLSQDEELRSLLENKPVQMNLFEDKILTPQARADYRIIGQVFDTYWLVEYKEKLLMIDQHAAHEKVLYEQFKKMIENSEIVSQNLMPPVVVTLSARQVETIERYMDNFVKLGFELEPFGGKEFAIRAVPDRFYHIDTGEIFTEILDLLSENEVKSVGSEIINDRIATMACKAAVKGNNSMTIEEINALLDELLTLDNPYNCPHGRPTMITMSKYEMEKKFKRIV